MSTSSVAESSVAESARPNVWRLGTFDERHAALKKLPPRVCVLLACHAAAIAFAKLPAERRAELLNSLPSEKELHREAALS